MPRPLSFIALAIAVAGVAYLLYPAANDEGRNTSQQPPQRPPTALLDPLLARQVATEPPPTSALPVAPVFDVDLHGRLLPSARSAVELEVLLAQVTDFSDRKELLRLENRVGEGLPDGARQDAARILHAYLEYRKAEAELDARQEGGETMAPEERFRQLVALRRHYLGQQVADAFFGERETISWYGIQASRIEADPALNVDQKLARLADLKKRMPAIALELPGDDPVEWQVASMRERGVSEDEIRQLRERTLDRASVQAISAMEAQNAEWKRRYQSFRQEAMAVQASSLNEQDKQQYLEVLLRQHYRDDEIPAVRGYDQEYGRR